MINKRGIIFPREMGPIQTSGAISCVGPYRHAPAGRLKGGETDRPWQRLQNACVKKFCILQYLIQLPFYAIIPADCMHDNERCVIYSYRVDFYLNSPLIESLRLGGSG